MKTDNQTVDAAEAAEFNKTWEDDDGHIWAEKNYMKYYMDYSDLALEDNKLFFRLTMWLYSFILKFIPSIALTVVTGFLIHALYKAEERSARLKNGRGGQQQPKADQPRPDQPGKLEVDEDAPDHNTIAVQTTNNIRVAVNNNGNVVASTLNHIRSIRRKSTHGVKPSSRKKSTDRTTRLLIVILVLFLLTEFPQVYIYLLHNIPEKFITTIYSMWVVGTLLHEVSVTLIKLLGTPFFFSVWQIMVCHFQKTILFFCIL